MMSYTEGQWHALIGLPPQYDHMKGCESYETYMEGYNSVEEKEVKRIKKIKGE